MSLLFLLALSAASMAAPLQPVPQVELPQYGGPWHVIAFMDNAKERRRTDEVKSYRIQGDGKVDVHVTYQVPGPRVPKPDDFHARITRDPSHAIWKVHPIRWLPFICTTNVIIDLPPDYSVATVAHPSRRCGWILAREKSIPPGAYARAVHALQAQGFDTSRLVLMPQTPDRIHAPRHGVRDRG